MQKVELLSYTPNPEAVVASAAKLCYSPSGIDEIISKLDDDKTEEFIAKLGKLGHYSPFEHASFTFGVEGVSRTLTHQLVRHRIASFSQQSQRYVKEDLFEFVTPPAIENDEDAKELFVNHMWNTQKVYDKIVNHLIFDMLLESKNKAKWMEIIKDDFNSNSSSDEILCDDGFELINDAYTEYKSLDDESIYNSKLLEVFSVFKSEFPSEYGSIEKKAIEDARYVFPNAVESKVVVTMNARSLINFFNLRCCNRAQWEIRRLADQMLALVHVVAPSLFASSGAACTFGKCPEGSMSCGKPRSLDDIIG